MRIMKVQDLDVIDLVVVLHLAPKAIALEPAVLIGLYFANEQAAELGLPVSSKGLWRACM